MDNPFKQDVIHFDEASHTYTVKKTGDRLVSVSQLIHKYSNPFDPDGSILKKCAIKEGISEKELKARWDKKRDDSCDRGTSFHKQAEHFINTGEIQDGPDKDILEKFSKVFIQKKNSKIYSEVLLYSIEDGICGTTDFIEYFPNDNIAGVRDFKTNEKLTNWGFKGQRMLPPLNHLQDSKISIYSLQLSTYSYLLDKLGYWIDDKNMCLYWVNPKKRIIEIIPIPYLRKEVIMMLEDFKKNKNK